MPSNFIVDVRLKENDTVRHERNNFRSVCQLCYDLVCVWTMATTLRTAFALPLLLARIGCIIPALCAQLVGQVLQLPVVRDVGLSKLHQKTVQALQTAAGSQLAEAPVPPAGSSLVHFLTQAGKFFGKDPTKWEAVGQGKVGSDASRWMCQTIL